MVCGRVCRPRYNYRTSGERRYYHASSSNACLFERVTLVSIKVDLGKLFAALQRVDLRDVSAA